MLKANSQPIAIKQITLRYERQERRGDREEKKTQRKEKEKKSRSTVTYVGLRFYHISAVCMLSMACGHLWCGGFGWCSVNDGSGWMRMVSVDEVGYAAYVWELMQLLFVRENNLNRGKRKVSSSNFIQNFPRRNWWHRTRELRKPTLHTLKMAGTAWIILTAVYTSEVFIVLTA